MNINDPSEIGLEELAETTIRLGRELQAFAKAVEVGANSSEVGFIARALRRLAERKPFDPRDDGSYQEVRSIVCAELQREAVGTERRFVETYYDDMGQHGEVRNFTLYSERGRSLLAFQEAFERFAEARNRTLDKVAAERAVRDLLSP